MSGRHRVFIIFNKCLLSNDGIQCSLFQYIEMTFFKKNLNSKQRTKLKTANSDSIYFRTWALLR